MAGVVATNYGEALFSLAMEENRLDAIKESLLLIDETIKANKELSLVLKHPKIEKEDKKEVLLKIFSDADSYVKNFMRLLVDKNRFGQFSEMVKVYVHLYNEHHQIEVAYVESATKLSDQQLADMQVMLEKKLSKKVEMKVSVNENLIAGVRVKIKDEILDNSAASRLERMKKEVVNTTL